MRGVKAWHAAHRNILPLPEFSECTLRECYFALLLFSRLSKYWTISRHVFTNLVWIAELFPNLCDRTNACIS